MTTRVAPRATGRSAGYTLVEISVVLLIVGLIIGAITIPLSTQIESQKIEQTDRMLEQAREALFSYVYQFGYFPCPADATSAGQEPAGTDHGTGACPTWYGFLPAAALNFTPRDAQGYAVDAWGGPSNRIRYAVSNQTVAGIATPFTKLDGLRSAGAPDLTPAVLLYVCSSGTGVVPGTNCGTAQTLANNAAAVIWSAGSNAATGGTNIDEAQNPNPNGGSADRIFVSRARSDGPGVVFDDQVLWISTPVLLAKLAAAGQVLTRRASSGAAAVVAGGGGAPPGTDDDDD